MNKPTQSPGRVCLFTMVLAAVPSLLFATTAFLPNEGRIPSKVTAVQVSLDGTGAVVDYLNHGRLLGLHRCGEEQKEEENGVS